MGMKAEWLRKKWEKKDTESVVFLLLLLCMALYYGWRLFALTPWYDELYTYYYFISRGPVYAAIHWPLPNNHVGYSVLSACLTIFGNAAIALRGVSWICSLISLCLLFRIGRRYFPKGCALIGVFCFASMQLVNNLAVQGRGYALTGCLYLLAVCELMEIVSGRKKILNYVLLAFSFVLSLYALPSSVYFVVPLCVVGGTWLLKQREIKEFIRLFMTAVISALITVGLYTVIWLAIGSNLLSKTPESGCYGQGHVSIILHEPLLAARTGIEYMLDTPYIQSVPRDGYLARFGIWIQALLESYYPGLSVLLIVGITAGFAVMLWKALAAKEQKNNSQDFLEWYLVLSFILTPLMLIIQAALPYYRVFSFFGIPIALLFAWLVSQIVMSAEKRIGHGKTGCAVFILTALLGCVSFFNLLSPAGREQYSGREAAVEDAFLHMEKEDAVVCVTDCDQEYLLKYLFGREDGSRVIEESEYVLLDRELFLTEAEMAERDAAGADAWKFYVTHDGIPWEYLETNMEVCYENERFVLYHRAG